MFASPSLVPRLRSLAAVRGLALLLVLLAACRRGGETTAPTGPEAPPAGPASELRRTYDLPAGDVSWSPEDYQKVRDVFVRLERERPGLLPRLDGPDGAWLRRLVALDGVDAAAQRTHGHDELTALHLAVADILQLYAGRALAGGDHGREYLAVAAAFFKLSAVRIDRLAADDTRRSTFVEARFYLARSVHDVLASSLSLPDTIDPAVAVATFVPIADVVAPWFLPEERDRILDLADRLAAVDVAAADLAALRTAFAPDREPHARVDALAEALREHAEQQEAVLAAVAAGALQPVEVGREGAQVRWAFPDAGFSAVFPRRPNAQRQNFTTADGVAMTTRMLALKQPGDASRLVTCSARAKPIPGRTPADEVRGIADTMHLQAVRAIEVEGAAGLEGTLTTGTAHGLVRVVAVGDATCVVVGEAPSARARELADELRRFVDSFRPGPARGR
ncbi:hypothetical protein SAMN02745121_05996 [Nannocystis exedens]|uniref:Uncharacterized protein n=1 Tax=Nannocystis exedens TaxID=54 RepID=A0A1I2EC24_9BACT|nr:hypothetical protein [Nannocystis exedens]PCC74825.1 hypothetical protein NAEX_07925 [Nannocystis exedens]SFE90217.1 hypothetical protein SAMN02745121_05996 [Nannocystis exedens]